MAYLIVHASGVILTLLALSVSSAILRDRRAPGSAILWLLLIIFVPYLGVAAFLVLGKRKVRQVVRAGSGPALVPGLDLWSRMGGSPSQLTAPAEIISDGVRAFHEIEARLQEAQHSILFETFIFKWDETGQRIFKVLCECAERGVQVSLLLDGFGQLMGSKIKGRVPSHLQSVFRVHVFSPPLTSLLRGSINLRNHRKLVVIDEKLAFVGGMNVATEYMGATPIPERWQDFVFVLRGKIVAALIQVFAEDWQVSGGPAIGVKDFLISADAQRPTGPSVICMPSGPNLVYDSIYASLTWHICRAQTRIWIVTPYFVPDEALIRVLMIAALGGVDVRLILPRKSNHPMTDLARGSALRDLQVAGAKIIYFPKMIHAKLVMVDGEKSLIGSANMDIRSLFLNYELGLWVEDQEFTQKLEQEFLDLTQVSSDADLRVGPIRESIEGVARTFSPML